MYNGLKCLPVKIDYSNLCIRFETLHSRISHVGHSNLFMSQPKLAMSELIDSHVDVFHLMYLFEGNRFGIWKKSTLKLGLIERV